MALTQTQVGTQSKVFGAVSQADLTSSLNPSLAQSRVIRIHKNISSYSQTSCK